MLPNLFLSYSKDTDLPTVCNSFLQQLSRYDANILISLSVSSSLSTQLKTFTKTLKLYIEFNHSGDENSAVRNTDEFILTLFEEMKNRTTMLKKKPLLVLPLLVVFMDDIFEVLRSKNRKTTSAFILLLRIGASVKIFFIIGSVGIYRNLLEQIINELPVKPTSIKSTDASKSFQVLGAELVMNFDGLIFFKEKGEFIYKTFYPL